MNRTIAVEVGCRSSGAEDLVKPGCGGSIEKYKCRQENPWKLTVCKQSGN